MTNIQNKRDATRLALSSRQQKKWLSTETCLTLINTNKDSPLKKSYWNTYHCIKTLLIDENGKITSTYCKNRWCHVCNSINGMRHYNSYNKDIKEMKNPMFVTLTVPTVTGTNLKNRIINSEKIWRTIYKLSKKAKYKKTYEPLKGLRKTEVTIRPNDLYHYHFHFILDGKKEADWLIEKWLHYNKDASPSAQHKSDMIKFAIEHRKKNPHKDYDGTKELFKYAVKSTLKIDNPINAKRYDLVYQALKGKRTLSTFGGIKQITEVFEDSDLVNKITIDDINAVYNYNHDIGDHVNKENGLLLSGEEIPQEIKEKLLSKKTIEKRKLQSK